MGIEATMAWLWSNRRIVAEVVGIAVLAGILWWAFWYNPRQIKNLQAEIDEKNRQIQIAHETINILGTIERAHDAIDKQSFRNISTIRRSPKPGRNGIFVPGGVL